MLSAAAAGVTPPLSTTARKVRSRSIIRKSERLSFKTFDILIWRRRMMPPCAHDSGLWLPLITPFKDGAVDFASYERLVAHYVAARRRCALPARHDRRIADPRRRRERGADRAHARGRAATCRSIVGVGGNATHKVAKTLKRLERLPFAGIVSVCPYYNRPSQDGLIAHFQGDRLGDRPRRVHLQHPLPHGGEPLERLAARARRGAQHRRREGQLRHPRPVARPAGAQARRASRC